MQNVRYQQFVILYKVKDLVPESSIHTKTHEILRFAQDDKLLFQSIFESTFAIPTRPFIVDGK